jgi:hypothetical protein
MDPLSATATITSLCFTSGKILVGFFEYIHDIKDAPSYIEALTGELSALNTALMGLRTLIIVREGSRRDVLLKMTENSTIALDNCKETLHQIEEMVKKSKIKTKQSSHGQVITCIKWLWNKKEVILLKDRLEAYKSTISLMLQILSG